MKQENFNKKIQNASVEDLRDAIFDDLHSSLLNLSCQTKQEHTEIVFNSITGFIKRNFPTMTLLQISQAITNGTYGMYGDYSKVNPKTVMAWINERKKEVDKINYSKDKAKEHDVRMISNSEFKGDAILLGLFYFENKMPEINFNQRVDMIKNNDVCPNTKRKCREIVHSYVTKMFNKIS